MGYYTRFSLKVESHDENVTAAELIAQLRAQNEWAEYALNDDGGFGGERTKWYDYEKDLAEFSAENPGVLFTLYGEGEQPGDLWRLYARNGKTQKAKAVMTYAEPTV